ncbi:MAG: hypothetical protein F6J94_25810 [Moorea sp. SIO1F2]|uniref:hypothetical protein n=1 Tax=Moorena sp. SIO1F2 TaxID=2607819 RepID=UPI0013B86221|nr:hypothetical protein [Moorena sp. SIO1F2]NET85205.1 hypothetical protein [Moorena sp. SIO1F2]
MPIAHTTHSNQTPHHPITPSLKKVVPGWWAVADYSLGCLLIPLLATAHPTIIPINPSPHL